MFYLFLIFGLLIRLFLVPVAGFKADVAFWKGWGLAVADKGIIWLVNNTNYNYPPGFAYVLWLINKVYAFFGNPYDINEYWADNNALYLFLIKLITIIADVVVVWMIVKIGRLIVIPAKAGIQKITGSPLKGTIAQSWSGMTNKTPEILALFYFLNPAVIYDGVIWGQVDQFGLAFLLTSCYLLLINRPRWAVVVIVVGCLMKLQNIIFLPLIFLYVFKKYSFREVIITLGMGLLTFLIVVSPFILGRQMEKLYWLLTVNSDWFPWYSLNSFNIWWILSGLKGMQMNDKHLVLGIISAKQLGLYMFIFAYFISSITIFFSKSENLFRNFIVACSLAVFAFFHLLTQSHERYLFPVMGLLPILFIYQLKSEALNPKSETNSNSQNSNVPKFRISNFEFRISTKNKFLVIFIFFSLVSLAFFTNMYVSMGWNYPDQVIPRFAREQTLGLSWWISIIQLLLFVVFVVWYFKEIVRKNIGIVSLFAGLLVSLLFVKNINYLAGKPVSLTSLKPIGYSQDYLEPVYNKTVESARGVKYWNRLSVNYYFYDKGVGSHADSVITYHLGRKFSKFTTDFGIDTESDQNAKVYFSLIGDGRELFRSDVKGRFDKPGTTNVNVKGINYLTLKITKAGETNFGSHADWLDPILFK